MNVVDRTVDFFYEKQMPQGEVSRLSAILRYQLNVVFFWIILRLIG